MNDASMSAWRKLAGSAALVLCAATDVSFAEAPPQAAVIPASRAAAFASWQRAHGDQERRIEDLKARTAELIETYVPYVPPIVYAAQTSTTMIKETRLDADAAIWHVPGTLEIWDDVAAPRLIVVPAGEFTMGSPSSEAHREDRENPRHRVRIAYPLAVSRYPVTVSEFAMFVAETGHEVADQCQMFIDDKWDNLAGCTWRNPGFKQGDDSPAVVLDWNDAHAYVTWLSKKTGKRYRMLSEAEYEYATRAGTTTAYWWGDDMAEACKHANGADLDAKAHKGFGEWRVNNCHDGYVYTAPVTTLKANPFGLFGMTGNAWSWVADCWNDSYYNAPADGSANRAGICTQHVVRGGSWAERPEMLRSAKRGWNYVNVRFAMNGLRVAREL